MYHRLKKHKGRVISEWIFKFVPSIKKDDFHEQWFGSAKSPYPDQRLPQHESLGLKSARIEIPHGGSHYIDFSKTYFY